MNRHAIGRLNADPHRIAGNAADYNLNVKAGKDDRLSFAPA
jgi:hypothetical protein